MNCKICGNELVPGSKFCPNCGASQEAEAAPQVPHCIKCGSELIPGSKFCPSCGASQEAEAAPQVPHCIKCGSELVQGSKFCPVCGASQEAEAAPQVPHCIKCGSELVQGSKFCPVCGASQEAGAPQAPQSSPKSTPKSGSQGAPKNTPKKGSFKFILAAVLVVAVAMFAFSTIQKQNEQKEKQEALSTYISGDLAELEDIKEQLMDTMEKSLEGDSDSLEDARKLCAEMTTKVALAGTNEATAVHDNEISAVHSLYMDFVSKSNDVYKVWSDAWKADDINMVPDVIDRMEEADSLYGQFQSDLAALANEREVSYSKNSELPWENNIRTLKNLMENFTG